MLLTGIKIEKSAEGEKESQLWPLNTPAFDSLSYFFFFSFHPETFTAAPIVSSILAARSGLIIDCKRTSCAAILPPHPISKREIHKPSMSKRAFYRIEVSL